MIGDIELPLPQPTSPPKKRPRILLINFIIMGKRKQNHAGSNFLGWFEGWGGGRGCQQPQKWYNHILNFTYFTILKKIISLPIFFLNGGSLLGPQDLGHLLQPFYQGPGYRSASPLLRSISPAAHLWKNQIFFMAFVCASFVLVCAENYFVCAQLEKKLFKK